MSDARDASDARDVGGARGREAQTREAQRARAWVYRHRLGVRFRDCDAMNHVNHAVYFTYLEQCLARAKPIPIPARRATIDRMVYIFGKDT